MASWKREADGCDPLGSTCTAAWGLDGDIAAAQAPEPRKQFPKDQFKGLAESNFSNLFSKLCGFYFHYTSDPVPKDVQQWNVKRIGIDKNNRHKDTIAFRDFWTKLDEFLAEKRKRGDFEIAY